MPPSSVPIAIARMSGHPMARMTGTSVTAQRIVARLNVAGDNDGMKNRCSEFSIPIMAAATATVVRNGSITCVSSVVSSSLPGTRANLGAISEVMGPANTIPAIANVPVMTSSALITRLPKRHACSRPRC
jgi:acetaldehyde dehydrogenase (acetylating)